MTYIEFISDLLSRINVGMPIYTKQISYEMSKEYNLSEKDAAAAVSVALKRIMDGKRPSEKLIPLKPDTVCCYINRACKKLGFNEIVSAKTSVHCLRKYSITNYYKEKCKEVGPDRARELAMLRLGHSKDRMDLFKTYIKL